MPDALIDLLTSSRGSLWPWQLACPSGERPVEERTIGRWRSLGCVTAAGKREGLWKGWYAEDSWYEKDLRWFEGTYVHDRKEGVWREWGEDVDNQL
ncbi:MAG TPA: hypothetical protein VKM54_17815 [Myxococcota bacterium]|nr:hypothetical protein [Myxococcota bacterium]